MGRRNLLVPYKVITSGDMSQTSLTSLVTTVSGSDVINYQAVWTGTPTGSFDFQASNDQLTWTSITFASAFSASGAAGNLMANIVNIGSPYVRCVYTKTSGTGTLNVTITANSVGA